MCISNQTTQGTNKMKNDVINNINKINNDANEYFDSLIEMFVDNIQEGCSGVDAFYDVVEHAYDVLCDIDDDNDTQKTLHRIALLKFYDVFKCFQN